MRKKGNGREEARASHTIWLTTVTIKHPKISVTSSITAVLLSCGTGAFCSVLLFRLRQIRGLSKASDAESHPVSFESSQEVREREKLWGAFQVLCSRHADIIHIPPIFHWSEHSHMVLTARQHGKDSICTQKKENVGLIKHNIYPASICSSVSN